MATTPRRSSEIFAASALLALPVILALLPARYQLMPRGIPFLVAAALAIPMLAEGFAPGSMYFRRLESYAAAVVLPVAMILVLTVLGHLFVDMVQRSSGLSGLTLLTTSISIWATNVLIFALAFWQLDRGGPSGRAMGWRGRADFTFPRGDPCDGVPQDWQPAFADYLYLAFNTATAFSPTDVLPLTPRAKMLMMIESVVSLITVVAVGARAINILGS
jgi:uncharacterized membrane protein